MEQQKKCVFNDVRSNFILKKIFHDLDKRIYCQIIRYNKNLQKKINIELEDYHQLYKIYSKIELEIIPTSPFINKEEIIKMNNDRSFYHIHYIYDKNQKSKKKREPLTRIKIVIDTEFESLKGLFKDCTGIYKFNLLKYKRIDVTDMSEMFSGCFNMVEINLPNIKVFNVTDMSSMFAGCKALEKLDLSNFDTKNVTNMSHMFEDCENLFELDISNFNTSKVIYMNSMFYGCINLEKINLSNIDIRNVIDMGSMFYNCISLEELDLRKLNTENVVNMRATIIIMLSIHLIKE